MLDIQLLIEAIKNGESQGHELIELLITHITSQEIDERDVIAWLKVMHEHGCSQDDMVYLTECMRDSGAVLSWDESAPVVDKHSTGGVGDKMSIMLAPALAVYDVRVPMLAGRSLGHTGGTIDKLESIPGFSCLHSPDTMKTIVEKIGCCIVAQNPKIAPADGRLYALRDVTNTIDNVQLITASIVSKKSAEGLHALVLDVKCGRAAFMKTLEQAKKLATSMVETANGCGITAVAQITAMEHPIGSHVGNTLEVIESIEVLKGRGHIDTIQLVELQGGALLHLVGKADSQEDGENMIRASFNNGSALEKFKQMCNAQGMSKQQVSDLIQHPESFLPQAVFQTNIFAQQSGYLQLIDAMELAELLREMGAGRFEIDDEIDPSVGAVIHVDVDEFVEQGTAIFTIHHNHPLSEQQLARFNAISSYSEIAGKKQHRLLEVVSIDT